jgi:signal peptidase II
VDAAAGRPTLATSRRNRLVVVLVCVAVGVVVLDQLTKWWAVQELLPRILSGQPPIQVVGDLLRLTYTENTGAAFSIGTGFTWIFSAIAVVVVVVIIRTSRRLGSLAWAIALGGLLGGALGNLVDRLFRQPGPGRGYVVDWIALPNFPVFNVADMCIVGSATLMVVLSLLGIEYDGSHRGSDDAGADDAGADDVSVDDANGDDARADDAVADGTEG